MLSLKAKRTAFISTFMLSFFIVVGVEAKTLDLNFQHPEVAVKYVSQTISDPIEIEAGKTKTVTIKFKNIGTQTLNSWNQHKNGYRHISAYAMEPRGRKSELRGSNWIGADQTGSITKDTKPGEVAELEIELLAPDVTGEYTEEFQLAAENYSWVTGGYFFLKIKVVPPKIEGTEEIEVKKEVKVSHKAKKFIQSKKSVEAVGGERIKLILGFQNIGDTTWAEYGFISNQPTELASVGTKLSFADDVWQDSRIILKKEESVEAGKFFRETIYFRTPAKEGEYTARFNLEVNGKLVEDALVEIPVTVTADAPDHYTAPKSTQENPDPETYRFTTEQRIRVGLYRPETFVQFRSADSAYDVYTGTTKVGRFAKNKLGVLKFKDGKYNFKGGDLDIDSDEYIRLSPVENPHAEFTLWNYSRFVKWKGPRNFNRYRGALEYRRGEVNPDLWIVNDLLLEDYVQGIGENGNNSPTEYLKAQSVAQRSYAYATIVSDKYGIFDVVATTGDQLYLGVESERIMFNFVAAAKATRGQMATYDNNIVITPYFARTNCRTLGWHEKWGGKIKPWLVSVKTNYDCARGKSMFGHGVGMSQIDASIRAEEEGIGWRELVKYYYTGVETERVYL
jgi:hypothetical protein